MLDKMLNDKEKGILRRKLREFKKIDLHLLCYRLCPLDRLIAKNRPDKEDFIALLMVYGLKHEDAPNYLPSIED